MPRKPRTEARFFVAHSGGLITKVKLRPGQIAIHHDWQDDGSCITRGWSFDGYFVTIASLHDDRERVSTCAQRDLMSGYKSPCGVRFPRWQEDYTASIEARHG